MKLTPEQFKEHSQKVKDGHAKALREHNKKPGRPPILDKEEIRKLYWLHKRRVAEIASSFGVSRQAIYNIIN